VDAIEHDPNSLQAEDGFFVEVPNGGRVTVNGPTYINPTTGDEDEASSPFIIGPLNTYATIELLSQPLFFFRTQADLDFTQRAKAADARLTPDELARRDQNNNADPGAVTITWRPLEPQLASPDLP
jgi:hypothetical protein